MEDNTMSRKTFNAEDIQNNTEKIVTMYLLKLGMSIKTRGFRYIRSALIIMISENEREFMITKDLYPRIAKIYKTNDSSVERGMRQAINSVFKKENLENPTLNELLCITKKKHLSNSEFISLVVEKLLGNF